MKTLIQNHSKQTASHILLSKPLFFGFNPETSLDNEFQKKTDEADEVINNNAQNEFNRAIDIFIAKKINTLILEPNKELGNLYDAIFPNNWFSTDVLGNVFIYPMATASRAKEVRIEDLKKIFEKNNFKINKIIDLRTTISNHYLEGTGSLVFDHLAKTAYMAKSKRSSSDLAKIVCEIMQYELFDFETLSSNNKPFYHTNVMMSIGTNWAVICSEAISPKNQAKKIINKLHEAKKIIIDISLRQAESGFCANILEVNDKSGNQNTFMSKTAYDNFTQSQLNQLSQHTIINSIPIPTIEKVGGGSLRCMIAEIFLPKITD